MSSCCTRRLKRRKALSIDSPSFTLTSATHSHLPSALRVSARSASGGTDLLPQRMGLKRKGQSEAFSYADPYSSAEFLTIENSFMLVKSFQNKELQRPCGEIFCSRLRRSRARHLLTPSTPLWDNHGRLNARNSLILNGFRGTRDDRITAGVR